MVRQAAASDARSEGMIHRHGTVPIGGRSIAYLSVDVIAPSSKGARCVVSDCVVGAGAELQHRPEAEYELIRVGGISISETAHTVESCCLDLTACANA